MTFFIYSIIDGHLSYFQFEVIMNEMPMNVSVYVFCGCKHSFLLSVYPGMIQGLLLFNFNVAVAAQFFKVVLLRYIPASKVWMHHLLHIPSST